MLEKLLIGKYKIIGIPKELPYNSAEILTTIFRLKNVICFRFGKELRILSYVGNNPDFLGRATIFQPEVAFNGTGETYNSLTREQVALYNENALPNSAICPNYIFDDLLNFRYMIQAIDNTIMINSKQVLIPFLVSGVKNTNSINTLKKMFIDIFGDSFNKLIIDGEKTLSDKGLEIKTTNIQLVIQQLQDTKKKLLDEAFLYLGIGAPAGKLAHESIEEAEQNKVVVDLIANVIFDKINDFIIEINSKFNTKMELKKEF